MQDEYDFSKGEKMYDNALWTKTVTEMTRQQRFLKFKINLYAIHMILTVLKHDTGGEYPKYEIHLWFDNANVPVTESYLTKEERDERFDEIAEILG